MSFVEIERAGFLNKGAELMLRSVQRALQPRLPDCAFVSAALEDDFPQRSAHGLWQRAELWRGGWDFAAPVSLLPKHLRRRLGLVTRSEVALALDCSGMAYSGQWGAWPTKQLARRAEAWARKKTPFLLLPQAFGPFDEPSFKRFLSRAARHIQHFAVRDDWSLAFLRDCLGEDANIEKIPDITIGLEVAPKPTTAADWPTVLVVPNARMIDRQLPAQASAYFDFMVNALKLASASGADTRFLIHEGPQDEALAIRLAKEAQVAFPNLVPANAVEAKAQLSSADLILGSRFHALLGGLAGGVQTLGLGWSHKYTGLFKDFGCEEWLLPYDTHPSAALEQFAHALETPLPAEKREDLGKVREQMQRDLERYWDFVAQLAVTTKP
jgi:colanic acid/amylovoran biosynthesis protein